MLPTGSTNTVRRIPLIWLTRNLKLLLLACLPSAVTAEPQPAVQALMHHTADTAPCLARAATPDEARACIGLAAGRCMDADPVQNQTTTGMMFCAMAEAEAWDVLLNTHYQTALTTLRTADTHDADVFPEFANRVTALRDAQRAWITLRDADCTLEYAMWGAGTMRQIAGADCKLQKTAERAIYLRFLAAHLN